MRWEYLWEGTLEEKIEIAQQRWSGRELLGTVSDLPIPEEFYSYFASLQEEMKAALLNNPETTDPQEKLEYIKDVMYLDARLAFLVRNLAIGLEMSFDEYMLEEKKFFWRDYVLNVGYGDHTIIHQMLKKSHNDPEVFL